MKIADRIGVYLVDDARNVWKWWSTWLYLGIAVAGALALGFQSLPQEVQTCVSNYFPRWLLWGISIAGFLGPLFRVVKQGKRNG